jgi:hypothetical protein
MIRFATGLVIGLILGATIMANSEWLLHGPWSGALMWVLAGLGLLVFLSLSAFAIALIARGIPAVLRGFDRRRPAA